MEQPSRFERERGGGGENSFNFSAEGRRRNSLFPLIDLAPRPARPGSSRSRRAAVGQAGRWQAGRYADKTSMLRVGRGPGQDLGSAIVLAAKVEEVDYHPNEFNLKRGKGRQLSREGAARPRLADGKMTRCTVACSLYAVVEFSENIC